MALIRRVSSGDGRTEVRDAKNENDPRLECKDAWNRCSKNIADVIALLLPPNRFEETRTVRRGTTDTGEAATLVTKRSIKIRTVFAHGTKKPKDSFDNEGSKTRGTMLALEPSFASNRFAVSARIEEAELRGAR